MPNFEFQRNLPFTEFMENGSWLQKRHPGAFLVSFFVFFTCVLVSKSWFSFTLALLFATTGIFLSRVSMKSYLVRIEKVLPLIIIIAIINILLNPMKDSSQILIKFWIFRISWQDITQSLVLVARFILIMIVVNITTASLSISQFIHGLEQLLFPLTYLGIRVHDFIVSVEIAIRYIPLLTLTSERIAKAQASRGAAWGATGTNPFQKVKQITPIIIPLFLQSYQKADKIAMAMDARGYGVISKRSHYYTSTIHISDWLLVVASCILFLAAILIKV